MKALICGSFDPITNGHLDIIKRSAAIFDSVVVGIFINPEKKYFFDLDKRCELLKESVKDLKNVTVISNEGYVAKYVEKNGIDVIVKGIRNSVDYEYEAEMAKFNKQIYDKAETLFLPASDITAAVSSSLVKTMFLSGEDVSPFVPECVKRAFYEK